MSIDQPFPAYSHPEAYDIINAPGTLREVNGFEAIAARHVLRIPGRAGRKATRSLTWLEPCCGSGRYLRLIAGRMGRAAADPKVRKASCRSGRVIGIDLDPGMVAYAQTRLRRSAAGRCATVLQADIRRLPPRFVRTGSVDVAFCPHNSVRHLLTERDLLAHLGSIRRAISPRGIYIVGLELTPPEEMLASESVFVGKRGRLNVREVFEYLPPGDTDARRPLETVVTWLEVEQTGRDGGQARREIGSTYRLRCWRIEQWRRLVARSRLREIAVVDTRGRVLPIDYSRYALRVLRRA